MGFLSQIETKPTLRPPRIVIYSKHGVGKTTFAAGIPGVVFIPAEEGEGVLAYARLPRPESYEDVVNQIAELLTTDHQFKALTIDTMDHIEPLVWAKVCAEKTEGRKQYDSIEDFGYGKGYTHADPYWAKILRGLDALRRERGMTTVVLAHAEVKTAEDPVLGSYERFQTKLHKRANALLHEWADIVGYAELERSVRTNDDGKREVRVATTTGRRILHLEDRGGFDAKNRYGIPSPIELSWTALRGELTKAMKGAKPETTKAAGEKPAGEEAA
jgi:hypothetical protein